MDKSYFRDGCNKFIFKKTAHSSEQFIDKGNGIHDNGEEFTDCGVDDDMIPVCEGDDNWEAQFGNGEYDIWEQFIDQGNGVYDIGEEFTDFNNNGIGDEEEFFDYNQNEIRDETLINTFYDTTDVFKIWKGPYFRDENYNPYLTNPFLINNLTSGLTPYPRLTSNLSKR